MNYDLLKAPLISALSAYISKTARWKFFLLQNFDKQDEIQLLAKLKQILYMVFRATLNFNTLCKQDVLLTEQELSQFLKAKTISTY